MAVVREDVARVSVKVDNLSALNNLNDALDETKKMANSIGGDSLDELVKESKKAKEGVEGISEGGKDANDQLKKLAKHGFDKTISGLKTMATTLGRVGVAAGKLLAKGIVAGAAGVGALVAKSVTNYADYEQLVGGVDTLFKNASGTVQKNADQAYKTAGLSANDYMSTVTSFSASLIQSLGGDTAQAAKLSDQAIIDMSDNANKMGSDMASIQDAYQGFAKQNYTMLDNLKLGYGGTQEEMKRLLADASKLAGTKFDIKSYADIIQAIHVIQESMGIAGTTAKEASETITGSWSALKASWSNTLTALILGGEDFDRCVDNLIDSAKTFGKNIMPAITKALSGVGELIGELAPLIEKELPGLIKDLLPPLLKAATSLVKGLIIALPDIVKTLAAELPTILSELWGAVKEAFGDVPALEKAETFFGTLKTWFTDNLPTIKKLAPAITTLVAAFLSFKKIKSIASIFNVFGGGKGGAGGAGGASTFNAKTVATAMGGIATAIGGIGGIVAAFALLKQIDGYDEFMADGGTALKQLCDIIADIGLVGAAFVGFTGIVGKSISIADAATGIADIAIALGGMEAIVAAFGALAKIEGYSDFMAGGGAALQQLCGIIEDIGLIGAAFVSFVAVVGTFSNVAAAANGMGVIATALGGMEAVVLAFGALAQIPGIESFAADGGQLLTQLCNIIGDMAGNLIGGALAGLSDGLPDIGTNIAAFAEEIKPALETFGSINTTGISDFASALGSLMGALVADNVTSFFFGDIDYAQLGTDLSNFATNALTFFTTVKDIPDESFTKITSLFNALAGVKSLPTSGGIKGWFTGDIAFDKIAEGLAKLASDDFITAIGKIQNIPDAGLTAMTNLFNALAGVKGMPTEGGIFDAFTGEATTGMANLGKVLPDLATNVKTFFDNIGDRTDFTAFSSFLSALTSIASIDAEGGLFDWFTGTTSEALKALGEALPDLGGKIAGFMTAVGDNVDYTKLSGLFNTLNGLTFDDIDTKLGNLTSVARALEQFGSDKVKTFFTTVADLDATKLGTFYAFITNMNGVQDTTGITAVANSMKTLGSNTKTFASNINKMDATKLTALADFITSIGTAGEAVTGLETTMSTSLSNIVTTAETQLNALKGKFSDILGQIVVLVNATSSALYSSGRNMMVGLNNGMNSMRGQLMATARSIATSISSTINSAMDINSPSRVTFQSGEFIGQGLAEGMRSYAPDVKAAANEMAHSAIPFASHYSPTTDGGAVTHNRTSTEYTTISPAFNLTISGTSDARSTARKVKRWVAEAIQDTFESMERKSFVTREA